MKKLSTLILLLFIFLNPFQSMGQDFDLQFSTSKDCDADTYCATLQIKAASSSFLIGTSSIFVKYNEAALGFSTYESLRFNGVDFCIATVAPAWDEHTYDGMSIPGSFNLTLEIPSNSFSCPTIESDWIDIGTLCFAVTDASQSSNLSFDISNTNFNSSEPNDGSNAVGKGTLNNLDESLSCAAACADAGTTCDDGNAGTENDVEDGNCNCAGTACPTAGTACDDGNTSTENDVADGSCNCAGTACATAGTACDDGNASTENDVADGSCNCAGTACATAGTACDDGNAATENDIADGNCNCAGTVPSCPEAGTACDDGNVSTENDKEDGNCNCAGTACPTTGTACDDGNTSTENDIADGNCNCAGTACATAGTACDDGNASTENDIADGNCNCAGTACATAGTACDDGNASTENDVADGNCNCAGTACPTAGTACDDGNAATENDVADGSCNCAGTTPSCPAVGTACDDGNANTENDKEDGNCNCVGTVPCPTAGMTCDDGNASTENDVEDGNCNCAGTACPTAGTTCDDGNASTENDIADGNCNCAGTACPTAGTACDDGNASTENDIADGSCNCAGTTPSCPDAGTACDDGNANTENDKEDGNCNCAGTIPCAAAGTACDDGNANTENDKEDGDCNCAGTVIAVIGNESNNTACPTAGTPCSDEDLTTINDRHDGDCNCIGDAVLTNQEVIDLRLNPNLNCDDNLFCVQIEAKAQTSGFQLSDADLGFTYNSAALVFTSYNSEEFDENTLCGNTANTWAAHTTTSTSGAFDIAMDLIGTESCPEVINSSWQAIGTLCFDIIDANISPDLKFNNSKTTFTSFTNDGTAIDVGIINNIDNPEALSCQQLSNGGTILLAAKVLLQGPYDVTSNLMTDGLRSGNYIPLQEPYTSIPTFVHAGNGGGEVINGSVLGDSGDNSIIDWIFIELRSAVSPTSVIATRAALIQKDGDIVDLDGTSPVSFDVGVGDYYVAVKHRNHLGAMTASAITFDSGTATPFDFTDAANDTYGSNAQRIMEENNVRVLWGGNANQDAYLILVGGGLSLPDRDHIFFELFLTLWSVNPNGDISYNSILEGYFNSDTNMDGKVKFQGPENDIDKLIFFNILYHPNNTNFLLNYIVTEQIP